MPRLYRFLFLGVVGHSLKAELADIPDELAFTGTLFPLVADTATVSITLSVSVAPVERPWCS